MISPCGMLSVTLTDSCVSLPFYEEVYSVKCGVALVYDRSVKFISTRAEV